MVSDYTSILLEILNETWLVLQLVRLKVLNDWPLLCWFSMLDVLRPPGVSSVLDFDVSKTSQRPVRKSEDFSPKSPSENIGKMGSEKL